MREDAKKELLYSLERFSPWGIGRPGDCYAYSLFPVLARLSSHARAKSGVIWTTLATMWGAGPVKKRAAIASIDRTIEVEWSESEKSKLSCPACL